MIDPNDAKHRQRLSKAMQFWDQQMQAYRVNRRETIINYVGSKLWATSRGVKADKRMLGNLIQMSAQAHAVTLAYNEPRYLIVPNEPGAEQTAERLEKFHAKYTPMIGLGKKARAIALDSYFGFGISKVDIGFLPPGVQRVTGQQAGPMCWRVSQDNFGYDGSASEWDDVLFMYDVSTHPLDELQKFQPFLEFNPDATMGLQEYTINDANATGRIVNQSGGDRSAQPMTRVVNVYFPHAGVKACWPCNDGTFAQVSDKPLGAMPWNGHHAGPYDVMTHLDIPDNLLPIAQCESTKHLHYLFNSLADKTATQAEEAKINPIYEAGAQRDIERWEKTEDRKPMPVMSVNKLGQLEKPGPTQSQTAMMGAALQMFKEFSGNLDDILGLGPTAATAKQSELIRSSTTVRGGEARRKMNTMMESICRKLSHLVLNDQTMTLPSRQKIRGSSISIDTSWVPPNQMPRNSSADDYLYQVIQSSMEFRSANDRLRELNEATQQIVAIFQAVSQGAPIDLEKFIETQAKYRDLPELLDWWLPALPALGDAKQQGGASPIPGQDKPNGDYTRTNVSAQTNQGGLTQNLSQVGDDSGQGVALRAAG